ncbi:MAG: hypothetical protein A2X46_13855 [Lentisphaerae bacterium GWF2_57_35]|nr:MAG: hypothetical protein A2X46_13855 [Lentisphaerae bacterium GWF2_57_35]
MPVSNHSHRRRHRRSSEASSHIGGRIAGVILAVVILGYLALLASSFLGKVAQRGKISAPPKSVTAESVQAEPASDADLADKIRLSVRLWSRAPEIVRDAQRLLDKGQTSAAIEELETGLDSTPDVVEMKMLLAQAYLKKDQGSRSIVLLEEVLDIDPQQPTARVLLASTLILQKQYQAALDVAEWMLESGDVSARVHQIAATAYLNLDQGHLAIPHLRKIVSLDTGNAIAWNNLGVAYTRQGDYKRAIEAFNTLLQQNTANAVTYYNLSACYARQSMAEQTVNTLTRAANVFGSGFVGTWIHNSDFNAVRKDPQFAAFESAMGTNVNGTTAAPASMLQIIDPMNADQNSTPLKPEDLFRSDSVP